MKRVLLSVIFGLLFFSLTMSAQAQSGSKSPSQGQALKQAANKQKQQEHKKELSQKYGMSYAQVQQTIQLEKERDAKIKAINKQRIPNKHRQDKIKKVRLEFQTRFKGIMTPGQVAVYEREKVSEKAKYETSHKIIKEYAKALESQRKQGSAKPQEARIALRNRYEAQLAVVVGKEKAHAMITTADNNQTVKQTKIQGMNLSQKEKMSLAKKKRDYRKNIAKVDALKDKKKVARSKKEAIGEKHDRKVKEQVGEAKFAQYDKKRKASYDKKLSKKFGMSPEQIKAYKELQNRKAIEALKVKKSKLAPAEKESRLSSIRQDNDRKVRSLLTPAQYGKMTDQKAKSQAKKAVNQ